MAVITISREAGSPGDEIARRVCELLDYHYFDKFLMAQVAQETGISEAEVIDFSEDNYRMRGFVNALLGRSAPVATANVWTSSSNGRETRSVADVDEETAARFVAGIIRGLGEHDRVVVVGRGGQAILRDVPGVLHVRIIAGREDRVPRLMADEHLSRMEANSRMGEHDQASAQYIKRFYGIDWADPQHYHLVLNSSLLGVEGAAQVIAAAAREIEHALATPAVVAAA